MDTITLLVPVTEKYQTTIILFQVAALKLLHGSMTYFICSRYVSWLWRGIESFDIVISHACHYCPPSSTRKCLHSELSVSKMYHLYVNNVDEPVKPDIERVLV
jgi:hypothetical protein